MNAKAAIGIIVAIIIVAAVAIAVMHPPSSTTSTPPATTTGPGPTQTGTTSTSLKGVVLHGDGATFPYAQYSKWFADFRRETGIVVEYTPTGSGKGQQDFIEGLVDFAGSDPPMPHNLWLVAKRKFGGVLQAPTIAGAVVVVFNIPGVKKLNLTGCVLAKIFMGEIKYWDDPAIQKLNPGVKLPHKEIIPVHRSDSSGTTKYFTYYLAKSCKEWAEKYGYGKVWPVQGVGIGAQGNPGVAEAVKNTPYSIGYVEYAYALEYRLPIAALSPPGDNSHFYLPNEKTAEEVLSEVAKMLPAPDEDWSKTFGKTIDAAAKIGGYPLIAYTHILVRMKYDDPKKCEAMKMLLEWLYRANVEKLDIVKGYFPLPKPLAEKLLQAANMVCK